ncbi:MAG: Tm-1-like ATP-binding domain-containing protein [Fusobacteriaceae bacterium]|jgi:uncharacterized protein (UPF0261 family)|nr:Tm-1-like ATP-binding domain-containing protein [Fusobacteriaceae bacterium]
MIKKIVMLGTFDTKDKEFSYLFSELKKYYDNILTINTGILGSTTLFPVDIEASEVSLLGGEELISLQKKGDRGFAVKIMCDGAKKLIDRLYASGEIVGVIGMGGGGGTAIVTTALQNLPVGFPKLCISTLASGDTSPYVGTKDIVLFPSIVDICGVNRFSRQIISRAAAAFCGMVNQPIPESVKDRPIIFISMFGNTTKCVEECARLLEKEGYDSIVFHATGIGGKALEELTMEHYPAAVLDITTTEWADEIAGGVLSAGSSRLDAPGITGIPHLIAPGCVDMVNFGPMNTVPEHFIKEGRLFNKWTPMVTLMRSNKEENEKIGKIFANKANKAKGSVEFIFPLGGFSMLDCEGQPFYDPETNNALLESLKANIKNDIKIHTVAENINNPVFSKTAVDLLLGMLKIKNKK